VGFLIGEELKELTLIQLKPGHKARVISISGGKNLHDRMMTLGIYNNQEISKLSHIGLKGPVVVKVGRSIIALGHGVAEKITVGI